MESLSILDATIAGIIQGITELLPISSSGHLLLFSSLSEVELSILSIAVLHLGTVGSLLIVMKDKIPEALERETSKKVVISIIPAGVIGLLFSDLIDSMLSSPGVIIFSLMAWGILLIAADRYAKNNDHKRSQLSSITTTQALAVGLTQPLAFIPGTSRSGVTTIAGILSGIDRRTALEFSFLSGIPLLAASGIYSLASLLTKGSLTSAEWGFISIATILAFAIGIGAALIFRKFINRSILTYCGLYRIGLALLLLLTGTI